MTPVLAADTWTSNAELIADVARLGYLRSHDTILDPTWGGGIWWKQWAPTKPALVQAPPEGSDFRALPYHAASFDAVAFDPPYVCPGGRKTSTVPELHARYGMAGDFKNPEELQAIIDAGLTECARVVKPSAVKALDPERPNGIILVKCQDYVWSGTLWRGTYHVQRHAIETLGLHLEDRFELLTGIGPQPTVNLDGSPRRQVHARRNYSTLLVFRKFR